MTGYVYQGADHDAVCREKQGTITGAHRHRRAGEKPCGPCLAAESAYRREWRANNEPSEDSVERRREWHRARGRALTRLAQRHPGEFETLARVELARVIEEGRSVS